MNSIQLKRIYNKLYRAFGRQYWWPAESAFEVVVGAVLTQNTAWANVEKAIINIKNEKFLSLGKLCSLSHQRMAQLIRPAGYFNIKVERLQNLLRFFKHTYGSSLRKVACVDTLTLRNQLLGVNGIGPETADSILLYAFQRPVFVVDAYTRRLLERLGKISQKATYDQIQQLFMKGLDPDTRLFNEYHALIVKLAKLYCAKNNPLCGACPLNDEHPKQKNYRPL